MENTKTIFKKEFRSYFYSPIAYIVISVFLAIVGWLFFSTFFLDRQASLTQFFSYLPIMFTFIIPAVTMRLFSEEINVGSYELLLTLPVSFRQIIMGKFMAAVAFIGIMLVPTVLYAVSTAFLGELDWGPVIGGYIGAMLLGAAFCAIGIFASSITRNQVVAFIIGVAVCFTITLLMDFILFFLPTAFVGIFQYLSANFHFQNIAKGVVDSRDIIYFISVALISLYGTNLIMQEQK